MKPPRVHVSKNDMVACWNMLKKFLKNSRLHPAVYVTAVGERLTVGRGKYRNIIIMRPSNCSKTFLIKPLESIFQIFANPASDKYAWVRAHDAEIIFWMISDGCMSWLSGKFCCYYFKVTKWGHQRLKIIFHVISKYKGTPQCLSPPSWENFSREI